MLFSKWSKYVKSSRKCNEMENLKFPHTLQVQLHRTLCRAHAQNYQAYAKFPMAPLPLRTPSPCLVYCCCCSQKVLPFTESVTFMYYLSSVTIFSSHEMLKQIVRQFWLNAKQNENEI